MLLSLFSHTMYVCNVCNVLYCSILGHILYDLLYCSVWRMRLYGWQAWQTSVWGHGEKWTSKHEGFWCRGIWVKYPSVEFVFVKLFVEIHIYKSIDRESEYRGHPNRLSVEYRGYSSSISVNLQNTWKFEPNITNITMIILPLNLT